MSHSRSAKKGSGCRAERIGGSVPKAGKVAGTSCGSGSMGSADREASRRNWAATKRSKAGRIGESANLSAPQPQSLERKLPHRCAHRPLDIAAS